IQFRPVTDGKYTYVFACVDTPVIDVPQFRSLPFGIPLAKLIAHRENTFFGPGLFLIPTRTADTRIKTVFSDSIQQRDGLKRVPAGIFPLLFNHLSRVDAILYITDN